MILPEFILPSRVNQRWQYSGIDSPDQCLDKEHFKNYPYDIVYAYNSRGFRDCEWPSDQELNQAIWCLGDSFTVGLGNPVEHIWPAQLEKILGQRTINVSMDGASNHWIARKAIDIIQQIAPNVIVIQWSYIHRGELDDVRLSDEDRRLHFVKHDQVELEFIQLVKQVESIKQSTRIIHSFIPDFGFKTNIVSIWNQVAGPSWPSCPTNLTEFYKLPEQVYNELINTFNLYTVFELYYQLHEGIEYVPEIQVSDRSRDSHHYGELTAQQFALTVSKLLLDRLI